MAISAEEIKSLIEQGLPRASVEIRDLAGDGNHYAATIVSDQFSGKSRVERHKMVYSILSENLSIEGNLHALALTTLTPDQAQANT